MTFKNPIGNVISVDFSKLSDLVRYSRIIHLIENMKMIFKNQVDSS